MNEKTIKEVVDIFTDTDKIIRETDKALREHDEWEARHNEFKQNRQNLVDRYQKLWKDNYLKLLNTEMDFEVLCDLETELHKWMHDLHNFNMKFADDKLLFNLDWEAFHIGQLLGFVEMKLK